MIRSLLFAVTLAAVAIIVGGTYLQPNDLFGCGASPTGVGKCQSVDAIVAISGGDTAARVSEAVNLYKNGWAKVLIFSGAAEDKTGPSNAEAMKAIALASGVPESAIYTDEYSETTKQNAQNVNLILKNLNFSKIILVTSGYHQRRADLEFERYCEGVIVLSHPVAVDEDWSYLWFMTPRGWYLAGSEAVKIVIFYATGK